MTTQRRPSAIQQRLQNETKMMIEKDEALIRTLSPENMPERRKYPEHEFRRHFLPIFSGEAYKRLPPDYTADQLANDASRYWMMVCGGPNAEVEVVEPDGSTAFIVPALSDTTMLNIAQPKDDPGLRKLNHDVLQKIQGLPDAAKRELVSGLDRKLVYMTSSGQGDRRDIKEKITKMREYYDLPDPSPASEGKSDANPGVGFMGAMSFD